MSRKRGNEQSRPVALIFNGVRLQISALVAAWSLSASKRKLMYPQRVFRVLRNKPNNAFGIGCILGAVVFLVLWGSKPLNPYDWQWIIEPYGWDPSFNAIGSLRFLKEPWHFPFSIVTGLTYPAITSVVFIDSIPIIAVPAKIIASLTGQAYQYIGIWGALCMMLQGGLSALILCRYSGDTILAGLGSLFFLLCPMMLMKMFVHISMPGQWVLLLGFVFIAYRD